MKNCLLILLAFFFFTSFTFSQTFQWQQLNGPFGGTPLCFVSKGSERFVGMDQNQGGVYRSSDDETAWGQESSGIDLDARAINWLAVDDSGYVIAGTNSHIGSRVYKSTDNGESWFVIENMGGNSVAQNEDGHIYVGNTGYGQYSVSTDGGYTWIHHSHTSPFINCIEINDSGHIFIGGNYTGYRSTDNGATWTNIPLPDGINSFAFAPNGDVYAGCSREYASNSGVYKSTDNGDSWTPVKEGFRVYPTDNIVINYAGDIFVGSDGWGIWRSTDEGSTWTQQNSGLHHFYIRSMYILSDGNIYAGALGGGIYRSTDNGESWRQTGVTSAYVKDLKVSPANGSLFASVVGMSRSTNAGLTWEPINNGISQRDVVSSEIKSIAIKSDGTIFIGFTNNWPTTFVYRSTDNGDSWVRVDNFPSGININGLTVGPNGEIIATASGYYALCQKSTDDGVTWQDIKYGQDIGCGKVAFNSVGDLFSAGDGVWRLSNNDTVWVKLRDGGIWTFFCSSNDYLFTEANRSTDNGLTWANIPIGNVAYSYTENSLGHLFAGTFNFGSGVKRSTDFGETWESINSGIPTQDVRSVAVDADDYLYAGPWGYSLYKTTTPTLTSVDNEKQITSSFSLEQNYPNPFNPNTVIGYQLPVSSEVTLKVFDVLGNEIVTLVDEYKPAGMHNVQFTINNLASGVYFYQLKAGSFVETKKMILLR